MSSSPYATFPTTPEEWALRKQALVSEIAGIDELLEKSPDMPAFQKDYFVQRRRACLTEYGALEKLLQTIDDLRRVRTSQPLAHKTDTRRHGPQ